MLRVGITGGIGSGKTTVCSIFEFLNVPVFYADAETKELYNSNQVLKAALITSFGKDIYSDAGLNKSLLSSIAFNNPDKLKLLNEIVHPHVFELYEEWCKQHQSFPYTLKEAAIIFESGSYKRLHKIIAVVAPESLRIQRVLKRDNLIESDVINRIKNQMPQEELKEKCDYTIINDGEQGLLKQVIHLHSELMSLSTLSPLPAYRQ